MFRNLWLSSVDAGEFIRWWVSRLAILGWCNSASSRSTPSVEWNGLCRVSIAYTLYESAEPGTRPKRLSHCAHGWLVPGSRRLQCLGGRRLKSSTSLNHNTTAALVCSTRLVYGCLVVSLCSLLYGCKYMARNSAHYNIRNCNRKNRKSNSLNHKLFLADKQPYFFLFWGLCIWSLFLAKPLPGAWKASWMQDWMEDKCLFPARHTMIDREEVPAHFTKKIRTQDLHTTSWLCIIATAPARWFFIKVISE